MNLYQRIVTFAMVALCIASHATEFVWRKGGKPVADTDNQKARDGFGALLVLVDDKKFFEDWKKPGPPRFTTIANAERMKPVHTAVIFAGPGRDTNGVADVTCDVTFRKPDGSVYAEQKDVVCTQGRVVPSPGLLQLARDRMVIRIEPHDPAGTYTVEVTVRDNLKKVDLALKEQFTIRK